MQRVRALFAPVAVIGVAHVVGGVAALAAPKAAQVSGLAGVTMLGAPAKVVGFVLVMVGIMAIMSRFYIMTRDMMQALAAPQQLLLMVQFVGVIIAIADGQYPDGYRPTDEWWSSMWFILADQAPLIAMCVSHTVEIAFGGIVNAERAFYQGELRYAQEKLEACTRRLSAQDEAQFWEEFTKTIARRENE